MEPGRGGESLRDREQCAHDNARLPFDLKFDPTLVRGMSYYTGTIFEIEIAGLGCSAGGGGRYDEMVGKFTEYEDPGLRLFHWFRAYHHHSDGSGLPGSWRGE